MADNNEAAAPPVIRTEGTGSLTIASDGETSGVKVVAFRDAEGTHLTVDVWVGDQREQFKALVTKERWPSVVIDLPAPVRQEGV